MLLVDKNRQCFDLDEIGRGTLVYAKHETWQEGQTGIVTEISERCMRVQYLPSVKNVLNHYLIPVQEAADGEWEIRYSTDGLETVSVFPEKLQEDEGGGTDGTEQVDIQKIGQP